VKKHFYILFFSFLLSSAVFAGENIDTSYVQKFRSLLSVKGFFLKNGFFYQITPQNNNLFTEKQLNDSRITYSANIPPLTGVSVNIKGVGFTYIFKFTNDYLDTTSRIKSGFKQFQINMYGNKFGFEAYYQDYSRFYFHYKGDEILLKNYNADIRAYQFGASGIFINNGKKFSYNAAFNQNQFQKKSAGSPLTVIALKYSEISSTNLIPDSVKKYFKEYPDLKSNKTYAFIFQQGYAYNLVKKSFYFSNALFVGVGLQSQVYETPSLKKNKIGVPLSARGKSSLGYNGKIFFGGIYANADLSQSKIKSLQTQQFQYTYGVFLGLRAITKTKTQIKQEVKRKKELEKEAAKKAKADAKKAAAEKKKKK
jgi:hypothetical protein